MIVADDDGGDGDDGGDDDYDTNNGGDGDDFNAENGVGQPASAQISLQVLCELMWKKMIDDHDDN